MKAELAFDAAIAELQRAKGLFRGFLTHPKRALLEERLLSARADINRALDELRREPIERDPLDAAAPEPARNVFPLRRR